MKRLRSRLIEIRKNSNIARIIMFALFLLYSFTMLYALYWAFVNSFNDPVAYMLNKNAFPKKFRFENYAQAFKLLQANDTDLITMLVNSLWLCLGRTFISAYFLATCAYAFSKYNFWGKKVIWAVLILTLMLPLYGGSATKMKLIHAIGLYDNPLYPLLISVSIQGTLLPIMRSYFDGISWEYAEAAQIDGASKYRVLFEVMIPLAMPCLGSLMILGLISSWNDYTTALYFLPSFPTITTGLYLYAETSKYSINYPVYFAGIMLTCIPTLLLFIFAQKKIMSNIAMGGLKG